MTIREFLAQLPDDFFSHLNEASIENIVMGLPDPLWKRLVEAVRHRLIGEQCLYPNEAEWQLWNSGKKVPAIREHRNRTGVTIKESRDMLQAGRLDTMVSLIFNEDEEDECSSSA